MKRSVAACLAVYSSLMLVVLAFLLSSASFRQAGNKTKVSIKGTRWFLQNQPVNKGSAAEGLLTNVRMVNAVFEDAGPAKTNLPPGFDPEKNTGSFVRKLPEYVSHGVRGFTISLQGGLPGYEGAVNSAFNANGSLRTSYMKRVSAVVKAADVHGAVIILSCFYQRQHTHERALAGKQAILNAVSNVARWISEEKFTNVVLEISNEYAHAGYQKWKDGEWLKTVSGQVELIRYAKAASPRLLVSTSGMGDGQMADSIARAVDFITLHFNNTSLKDIPVRIKQALIFGKPVICNEDDKIGEEGAEAARLSVMAGAGWGLMESKINQSVPFQFNGAEDDPAVYSMFSRLSRPDKN